MALMICVNVGSLGAVILFDGFLGQSEEEEGGSDVFFGVCDGNGGGS